MLEAAGRRYQDFDDATAAMGFHIVGIAYYLYRRAGKPMGDEFSNFKLWLDASVIEPFLDSLEDEEKDEEKDEDDSEDKPPFIEALEALSGINFYLYRLAGSEQPFQDWIESTIEPVFCRNIGVEQQEAFGKPLIESEDDLDEAALIESLTVQIAATTNYLYQEALCPLGDGFEAQTLWCNVTLWEPSSAFMRTVA